MGVMVGERAGERGMKRMEEGKGYRYLYSSTYELEGGVCCQPVVSTNLIRRWLSCFCYWQNVMVHMFQGSWLRWDKSRCW
jgi:hypothetical protein